jgi:hypothetical protein
VPQRANQDSTPTPEPATPTEATPTVDAWETDPMADLPPEDLGQPGFRALPGEDEGDLGGPWGPGSGDGGGRGDGTVPGSAAQPTTETTGSSPGSIAEGVARLITTVLGMVTLFIHTWRTPGENPVWFATGDELEGMAQPLARIASRRVPKGIGGSNDLTDGLEAGIAATAYAIRNRAAEQEYQAQRGYVAPPERQAEERGETVAAPAPAPTADPLDVLRGLR